jgi:PAS domain S-box-containing protein
MDSGESYRAIFDASEDAILVLDWNTGAIRDANRKAVESYGYTHDELVCLTCADLNSPAAGYTVEKMQPFFMAAREGVCEPFEWHRRNKDGSLHWDEVHLKPIAIGGKPVILAFAREVTDRKHALQQLQLREEQYRAIFEASTDAMFLWDPDMRLVDANPAGLAMYRYTSEQLASGFEALGDHYRNSLPEEHRASRVGMLKRAAEGHTTHIETVSMRADGTWFDADLRVIPFRHRGQPHALAVIRDISDRRRRERELQQSEARLRATVEAAFDCVITMGQDGRVIEFNAAAERVFGYRRADVLGRNLADLLLPERYRAAHERGLAQFPSSGRGPMVGRLVETTARRADGTEFPVELAVSVAAVPDGNIFVGHLRDISQRKAAESERTALEAQLRQAQKMEAVGQLTGGIAHDFNNILTSVMGYVVLGQERAEQVGDATLVRQLGQAHLAAQRARDLISQMLAFARRQKGDPRPLALTPLARQTLRLLRSTLPSSIALDAQWLDADGSGEAAWVVADPVQLEQILFNLCINARDAMQGTGRITVRLGTHVGGCWTCASCREPVGSGPWVELSVADTGSGIAPEHRDRIFDPFFSTKAPGHGSGMGLAMVHGIVHDHGGHILLDSAPDEGATFRVLLPPATPEDRLSLTWPAGAARAARPMAGRVLLVEDDLSVGDYLREQLASWGLEVRLMRDPHEAVAWIADPGQHADLVVTDLTMPRMTGLQLAREVAQLRSGLPVLLVTGHGAELDGQELAASGVVRVLRKPVEPAVLRSALERVLLRV